MPRFARVGLLAALLLAALARPALGSGWRWGYTAAYSYPVYPASYYPTYYRVPAVVTVTYAPAWQVYATPAPVYCAPVVPVAPAPLYAVPTPAPPSRTAEPPAAPTVIEARSGAALKTVPVSADSDRVRVGFWNVSGRDLTLTIDGRARVLPRNRSITLDLGRQFVWRIDARAPQNESIPADKSTLEIVLRR
jgi:hypothetical protein